MTDCRTCQIHTALVTEDKPKHGRPPRGLVDITVPVEQFGALGTAGICVPDYNKLLTTEQYRVKVLTSNVYPVDFTDALRQSPVYAGSFKWQPPSDDTATVPVIKAITLISTVRYLNIAAPTEYMEQGAFIAGCTITSTVRYISYRTTGDSTVQTPVLLSLNLITSAAYPKYTYHDTAVSTTPQFKGITIQ